MSAARHIPPPLPQSDAAEVLGLVLGEAIEIVAADRPQDPVTRIRDHVLDRWYRFAPFGVRSRADLTPIRVQIHTSRRRIGGRRVRCASTTVVVEGTPLEGKI